VADILQFPGASKLVVIDWCGPGVRVDMTPAERDRGKQVSIVFDQIEHARAYAAELLLCWGDCFNRVIDHTLGAGRPHDMESGTDGREKAEG
jgi:hypothetical protein